MYPESPQPGDVVQVDGDASVQFQGDRSMTFRVTRVDPRSTYDGWLWLEGHVLGPAGNALQRRRIFVRQEGLHAAGQALGRSILRDRRE